AARSPPAGGSDAAQDRAASAQGPGLQCHASFGDAPPAGRHTAYARTAGSPALGSEPRGELRLDARRQAHATGFGWIRVLRRAGPRRTHGRRALRRARTVMVEPTPARPSARDLGWAGSLAGRRALLTRSPSPRHLLDELRTERIQIGGRAARHQAFVDHHRFVD